jgi:eukaryotic-like serine/threonine-protein kinase
MGDTVSTGQVGKVCPQCGTEYPFEQRFCPNDGTTLRAKNATGDLVGSIIADRYHVVKKLGEGGMGQVYLAEHVKMGRKSAVKVMNPGMTPTPSRASTARHRTPAGSITRTSRRSTTSVRLPRGSSTSRWSSWRATR